MEAPRSSGAEAPPGDALMRTLGLIVESQGRIERRLESLCASQGVSAPTAQEEPAAGEDKEICKEVSFAQLYRRPSNVSLQHHSERSELSELAVRACWSLPAEWPDNVQPRLFGAGANRSVCDTLVSEMLSMSCVPLRASYWSNGSPETHSQHPALMEIVVQPSAWTFDPHGQVRIVFDLLSLVVLLYDLVGLPIILAWDVPIVGTLFVLTVGTITFWVADMILNFATAFYEDGVLVTGLARATKHYLRTWFVPDLTILLCNVISLALGMIDEDESKEGTQSQAVKFVRVAKMTRMLRIIGVARLIRMSEVLERFADRSFGSRLSPMLEIPVLVLVILFINHVIACCWFGIGRGAPRDTGMSWLELHVGPGPEEDVATYDDVGFLYQYSTSMHWSFTQMTPGSIQVNAVNSCERLFTISCLTLGMLFFSSIVSALSAKFMKYRLQKQESAQMLRNLHGLLRRKEISMSMAVSAHKAAQNRLATKQQVRLSDVRELDCLPQKMQQQLHYEMCKKHLVHQIFCWWRELDITAVEVFCYNAVNFVALQQHDTLFRASADAHSAYWIFAGELRYVQQTQTAQGEMQTIQHVGAGTQISEAALWSHWIHVGTAEASSSSELISIEVEKLAQAVDKSHIIALVFKEYGAAYHERILSARPPMLEWPDDLLVPGCSFEEILRSLSVTCREAISVPALRYMQQLEKSRWGMTMDQVLAELHRGACSLYLTANDVVDRLVSMVALKFVAADGAFLVELGRVEEDSVRVACRLPGVKQRKDEGPDEALARLVLGFPEASRMVPTSVTSNSERFVRMSGSHMRSVYFRTLYEADCTDSLADMQDAVPDPTSFMQSRLPPSQRLNIMGSDIFPFVRTSAQVQADEGLPQTTASRDAYLERYTFKVYAWLTPDLFEYLQSDRGRAQLSNCLSDAQISSEQLGAAVSMVPLQTWPYGEVSFLSATV